MNWYLHSIYCYLLYNICHFKWLSHIDVHIYIAIRQYLYICVHSTHTVNAEHSPVTKRIRDAFYIDVTDVLLDFVVSFSEQHNSRQYFSLCVCTYIFLLLYLLTNLIIMIWKWKENETILDFHRVRKMEERGGNLSTFAGLYFYHYYLSHVAPLLKNFIIICVAEARWSEVIIILKMAKRHQRRRRGRRRRRRRRERGRWDEFSTFTHYIFYNNGNNFISRYALRTQIGQSLSFEQHQWRQKHHRQHKYHRNMNI